MREIKLELAYIKSTKNTHVYGGEEQDAIMPSVYIAKVGLPAKPPIKLSVTIKYDET